MKKVSKSTCKDQKSVLYYKMRQNERASASSRMLNPVGAKLIKNLINLQKRFDKTEIDDILNDTRLKLEAS